MYRRLGIGAPGSAGAPVSPPNAARVVPSGRAEAPVERLVFDSGIATGLSARIGATEAA